MADGPIKDMTFIAEYTGDVDFVKEREDDECDSLMPLLPAKKLHLKVLSSVLISVEI